MFPSQRSFGEQSSGKVLVNHMTDIAQQIEAEKRELEAKLALISSKNLAALQEERKGYEAKIAEIDSKIQHICTELGKRHPSHHLA